MSAIESAGADGASRSTLNCWFDPASIESVFESLVRMRDHGLTAKYVQELKALGYDRLAIEDLVVLRDHGLTTDRIRAANARDGTRWPIDMLKSFAAGGMR